MSIQHTYFVDIETVPQQQYLPMNETGDLFKKKFKSEWDAGSTWEELYNQKGGLHAEFGKIVCISIGKVQGEKLFIKSIASKNEKEILQAFSEAIEKAMLICAHNGMDFDFSFLFRRYLINGLTVPSILNPTGKKPWDLKMEDTMVMWSGTQWKYRASLDLLANILGIPSPKKGITGADVSSVYYEMFNVASDELPFEKEDKALSTIADYCAGDITCLVNVYAKIKQCPSYTDVVMLPWERSKQQNLDL